MTVSYGQGRQTFTMMSNLKLLIQKFQKKLVLDLFFDIKFLFKMQKRLSWQEKLDGQPRIQTKKIQFNKFLMDYFAARNEYEMNKRLENMMIQLGLQYNKNNWNDYQELAYLLCEVLAYPSSDAADVHCSATLASTKLDQARDNEQKSPDFKCPCCDFTVPQPMNDQSEKNVAIPINQRALTTNNQVGQNKGGQNKDQKQQKANFGQAFSTYYTVSLLTTAQMLVAFLFFSIYAIISNLITSKAYRDDSHGQIADLAYQSYFMPLSFSFGSQQFYSTDFSHTAVKVQSWLIVVTAFIFLSVLLQFESLYRRNKNVFSIDKSIRNCSLQCTKMPLSSSQQMLESNIQNMLDNYYQTHNYQEKYRIKVKIVKINCAKPYGFQYYVSSEYEKLTELIKNKKEQFKQWIDHRKSHSEFPIEEKQRRKRYNEFKRLKQDRYMMHSQMIAQISKRIAQDEQITHADAFVTFDSEFVPALILRAQKEKMTICSQVSNELNPKEMLWVAAPEPEDLNWGKFGQGSCERVFRTFLSTVITVGALAGSFIILLGSSKFELYVNANNSQNKDGPIINFLISILLSTPIYLTNFLLKLLLEYLARNWEKHKTNSDVQISLGRKALLVMLINSIAIPVMINIIYKENIYGVGGLAEEVFYFSITNAILSVVLKIKYCNASFIILKLKIWYSRWVCNKWGSTQKQLNVASEYLFFEHGLEYASVSFTFLYSCFFLSLQPIIAIITSVGLILSCDATLTALITVNKRAIPSGPQVNDSFSKLIRLGPLFCTLGSILWTNLYAREVVHIRAPDFIALALSIIAILNPCGYFQLTQFVQTHKQSINQNQQQGRSNQNHQPFDPERVFRQGYKKSIEEFSYQKQKWNFNTEYDRLNPITAHEAIQKYNGEVNKYQLRLPKNVSPKTHMGYRQIFGYDEGFIRYGGSYLLA